MKPPHARPCLSTAYAACILLTAIVQHSAARQTSSFTTPRRVQDLSAAAAGQQLGSMVPDLSAAAAGQQLGSMVPDPSAAAAGQQLGSMVPDLSAAAAGQQLGSMVPEPSAAAAGQQLGSMVPDPSAAAAGQQLGSSGVACSSPKTSTDDPMPLDDSYLARGVLADSDWADSLKWALLAQKLQGGGQITVATFGGSITKGHGVKEHETYRHWLQAWLEAALPCAAGRVAVHNEGHGGTHPFMSRCQFTRDWADPAAAAAHPPLDLVVLEYACNGAGSNHGWSYELLVRSVMARFPTAAVLGFGSFWWLQSGKLRDFNKTLFSRVIEGELAIAQHYGFPYLSARDALYHSPLAEAPGASSPALISNWILPDGLHPNALGHRYYAALLTRLILRKLGAGAAPGGAQLKPALHQMNRAHFGGRHEACLLPGKAPFQAAILDSTGFALGDDGPGLDLKSGYVSDTPSTMLINASFPLPQFVFTVYLLRGWDNIADARIECSSGCRCKPYVLNGTWHQHTTEIVPVLMKVDQGGGGGGGCRIAITTLPSGRNVHQRIAALGMDS